MSFLKHSWLSMCAAGCLIGAAVAQSPEMLPPAAPGTGFANGTIPVAATGLVAGSEVPVPVAPLAMPSDVATCNRSGLIAGVGLYWMQPFFQSNPAYTVFVQQTKDTVLDPTKPATQTLAETAQRVEVKHHMQVTPLVWLGYMGEDGFGIRARGWAFQQGTNQNETLAPFAGQFKVGGAPGQQVIVASGTLTTISSATPLGLQAFGDTLGIQHGPEATVFTVTTKLDVQVGDFEVIQRLREGNDWSALISGGVRYVRLDQSYNAYDAQSGSPAALRSLVSQYDFDGFGPTFALALRRQLCDCGLGVYGQGRGSIVFGASDQNAMFFGQELRNDDPNPQIATEHRNRAIPIIDFEAGLEYGQAVGRCWLFGQIGVAGQQWFNAGSASRSTQMNPASTIRPVLGGAPIDSNIAFLGLTLHIGVNY